MHVHIHKKDTCDPNQTVKAKINVLGAKVVIFACSQHLTNIKRDFLIYTFESTCALDASFSSVEEVHTVNSCECSNL